MQMQSSLREHYYILILTNHLRLNILGFSLLLTIDDLRIYFNSVLFSFTTYFSTFLSRVCLKLTFLCATIIVNSHLLRPSSSKGLRHSFSTGALHPSIVRLHDPLCGSCNLSQIRFSSNLHDMSVTGGQ